MVRAFVPYLQQVVKHGTGRPPGEDEQAAQVDDDADRREAHDHEVIDAGVAKEACGRGGGRMLAGVAAKASLVHGCGGGRLHGIAFFNGD